MYNKFERFFYLLCLIFMFVGGIGGAIWMVVYGVTSDDIGLNILTWILIVIFGGLFVLLPFMKLSEWLEKKKILNKNQAHWFGLIPLTPLLVGQIIGLIVSVLGILYFLFSLASTPI